MKVGFLWYDTVSIGWWRVEKKSMFNFINYTGVGVRVALVVVFLYLS